MDKIKPPKNFTMSRENMKATLEAFKVGRSVVDVTCEIFHAISPPWQVELLPLLLPGHWCPCSKALALRPPGPPLKVRLRAPLSLQTLRGPNPLLLWLLGSSLLSTSPWRVASKGGTEVAPSATQSWQAAGTIVIGGTAGKRAQAFKASPEG